MPQLYTSTHLSAAIITIENPGHPTRSRGKMVTTSKTVSLEKQLHFHRNLSTDLRLKLCSSGVVSSKSTKEKAEKIQTICILQKKNIGT